MELLPFREKPGMFLKMRLADRTGEISAFVWDNAEDVRSQIAHADFVKVSGIARIYRDKFSINVTIASCVDVDMVDPNDFLPCTQKDRHSLLEELQSHVEKINNHHLRNLGSPAYLENSQRERRMADMDLISPRTRGGLLEVVVSDEVRIQTDLLLFPHIIWVAKR
jgi:3'-5' exoribonuclease